MKKYFLFAAMAITAITTSVSFNSCRKGEEDPAISLRSRKARLAGEWNLNAGKDDQTQNSSVSTTTYDGTNKIVTSNGQSDTTGYTNKMVINGDGTYTSTSVTTTKYVFWSFTQTTVETTEENGTWDFNSGLGDEKAKTKVLMHPVKNVTTTVTTTNGSTTTNISTDEYISNSFDYSMYLTRLSNKELKFTIEYNETTTGSSSSSSTWTGTRTYTAQ